MHSWEHSEMEKAKTEGLPLEVTAGANASGVAAKSGQAGLAVSETNVKAGGGGGRSFYDMGKK